MTKSEILGALNAVMKTLDTGITVTGVKNAGNLAGCFEIIANVAQYLDGCDITPKVSEEQTDAQ